VKIKTKRSLNSKTSNISADSPNLSAKGFRSSGSSRFSPYEITVSKPAIQPHRNPLSFTNGGPDVETVTIPSVVLESIKPAIWADAPEGLRSQACTGMRSTSNLLISVSASPSEIWVIAATFAHDIDKRAIQSSGKNEPLRLSRNNERDKVANMEKGRKDMQPREETQKKMRGTTRSDFHALLKKAATTVKHVPK
jgi:hypothetical protein